MLDPLFTVLSNHRQQSAPEGRYVFPSPEAAPLEVNNLRNRVWYPALEKAGLRKRTMYQTRHTFASLMLSYGEDPLWVARMMGHTSTEMLYRHYGKFIRNRKGKKGRTAWAQFGHKRAMHLNPVPSTSISCHGGLPPHPRRIRGPVYDGGRLPCISGSDALANRVSLPPMHCDRGMGYKTSVHDVQPVRTPSLRHGRNDLSPEPPSPADLVPRHVVAHKSKARGQRPWTAEVARARKLSDGLGLPPEAPARHGSNRSGLALRPSRSGRDVHRGSRGRGGPQTLGK